VELECLKINLKKSANFYNFRRQLFLTVSWCDTIKLRNRDFEAIKMLVIGLSSDKELRSIFERKVVTAVVNEYVIETSLSCQNHLR
jgi:hypothetical protein